MPELDLDEILDSYLNEKNLYCFEGESGMAKLNELCNDLGYKSDGFRYGSSFERFLQDNPGCCEAIIEWIRRQICSSEEWQQNLLCFIPEDDKEDEEDV